MAATFIHYLVPFNSVPYQGAQMYSQGGYGQASAGPWSQYPYTQAYGQAAAAQGAYIYTIFRFYDTAIILFAVLHRLLLIQVHICDVFMRITFAEKEFGNAYWLTIIILLLYLFIFTL